MAKRVLITGAAGFLGSHLCDRFIQEGFHVIGIDNLITGDLANIEHLFKLEQFDFYNHDSARVMRNMRAFAEKIIPQVNNGG